MPVNWSAHLSVDSAHVNILFKKQHDVSSGKLWVRGFTLPFQGTQQEPTRLIEYLSDILLAYVFPEDERPPEVKWRLARDKFGDIDPQSDGKLGELLLFLFVEAYLGTPLIAYKLKDIQNNNDQVKGADGVFVGEYQGQPAVLIGESKIYQSLKSAVASSLTSLNRFHDLPHVRSEELKVAKKYSEQRNLTPEELQLTKDLMDRNIGILVHPVFICYDCPAIPAISVSATDAVTAEAAIVQQIAKESALWDQGISSQKSLFPKPFEVHLDFIFLPVADCAALREAFYVMLHGHSWDSAAAKAAVTAFKKTLPKPRKKRKPSPLKK